MRTCLSCRMHSAVVQMLSKWHITSNSKEFLMYLQLSDFDGDDMISTYDVEQVVNRLTGNQKLNASDMAQLIRNVSKLSPPDDFTCYSTFGMPRPCQNLETKYPRHSTSLVGHWYLGSTFCAVTDICRSRFGWWQHAVICWVWTRHLEGSGLCQVSSI